MRPANALSPDRPQEPARCRCRGDARWRPRRDGRMRRCGGRRAGCAEDSYLLDAFDSGDAGPVGYVEDRRALDRKLDRRAHPIGGWRYQINSICTDLAARRDLLESCRCARRGIDALVAGRGKGCRRAGAGRHRQRHAARGAGIRRCVRRMLALQWCVPRVALPAASLRSRIRRCAMRCPEACILARIAAAPGGSGSAHR